MLILFTQNKMQLIARIIVSKMILDDKAIK